MARYLLSACLGALSFASSPAAAVPANPPAIADPTRIAAAERLLTAMHYDTQMDRIIEAVIGEVEHSIDRDLNTTLNQPLPPDVVAKIKTIADRHMRATFSDHRPELKRGTLLIYARHFTAPEL